VPKGYPNTPEGVERKRQRLIAFNKHPRTCAMRSESNRRRNQRDGNPLHRPEVWAKAARSRIGLKRSPETKAKMSRSRIAVMRRNGFYTMYRLAQEKQTFPRKRNCRSSWEARVSELLAADPRVRCWQFEGPKVSYLDGDVMRNTVPDFFVALTDGRRVIVEVKAACWMKKRAEQRKIDEVSAFARRNGFTYTVITDEHMESADPIAEVFKAEPWRPRFPRHRTRSAPRDPATSPFGAAPRIPRPRRRRPVPIAARGPEPTPQTGEPIPDPKDREPEAESAPRPRDPIPRPRTRPRP
jgi:hypothetical protein